jgi:hypothetical protein
MVQAHLVGISYHIGDRMQPGNEGPDLNIVMLREPPLTKLVVRVPVQAMVLGAEGNRPVV